MAAPEQTGTEDGAGKGAVLPQHRRALLAGSVGNFIEWYEFGVYSTVRALTCP